MKKIWILLGIALVLALFGFRERLEPTDKIKSPNYTRPYYSDEELDRAIGLVPRKLTDNFLRTTLGSSVDGEYARTAIREAAANTLYRFYVDKYSDATSPITEQDLGPEPEPINIMNDREQKRKVWEYALLKAYYIDQLKSAAPAAEATPSAAEPTPPAAEPTPPAAEPTPAGNQIPAQWTHACFFSPTNQ